MSTDDASSLPSGMPQPGETIDGKYSLVRVIGTGGMGVVYEAEHLRLKQRCAIKMLAPEMLRDGGIIDRFEREARASALLKSPHVTRVTDVATTPQGVPYIVMELLNGKDLDGILTSRGQLPFAEAVDYLLQACAAVAEAHTAGIIHRDLKPGNLFLALEEDRQILKVLDFGISKMVEEESKLTSAGMTMGTALYMSPEQLRSAATVDARSDIWSLGIILYELVSGQPPFVGSTTQIAAAIVSEDAPDITRRCPIPPELGAVIHRTLQRKPDDRFPNVAAFAMALAPFAPADSLGRAVAAQMFRRGSSRALPTTVGRPSSDPEMARIIDVEARTVHDVSTSAPHEVNTSARSDAASRKLLVAAIAVVGLLAALGAGAVAFRFLHRETPVGAPPTAAGSITATATTEPPALSTVSTVSGAGSAAEAPPVVSSTPTAVVSAEPSVPPKPGTTAATPARPVRPPASAATTTAPVRPPSSARPSTAPPVNNPTFLQ